MNRRLIGVIAGISMLGLGLPAFAAARGGDGTPEDNDVPGDVRGNCDEAEHADDPECLGDPTTTTIVVNGLRFARSMRTSASISASEMCIASSPKNVSSRSSVSTCPGC